MSKKNKDPKLPTHNCPALGEDTLVPRALNLLYPDKIYFKCPFCGYKVEEEKKPQE